MSNHDDYPDDVGKDLFRKRTVFMLVFGGLWALMLRYPKTSIGAMVLSVLAFLFWIARHHA